MIPANLMTLGCSLREDRAIDNYIESFEDATPTRVKHYHLLASHRIYREQTQEMKPATSFLC